MGTVLVLLITVIIFSSIILWVFTLPTPTSSGRVDIDGRLTGIYQGGSWAGATVNLTHRGGDNLFEGSTRVLLTIDNRTHVFVVRGMHFDGISVKSYGINGPDQTWNIGETWGYLNQTISESAQVAVMVVDIDKGLVLWDKSLLGVAGPKGPVFLDKWVDSDPTTTTRDRVNEGDTFTLYARVIDPDSDLNEASVWAYLTFGTGGVPLGYVQLVDNGDSGAGDKTAGDGTFSRSLSWVASKSWDGGIIILNATDDMGHESKSRLILSVGTGGAPGPSESGPDDLSLGGDLQKWDIFEANDWDANRYDANSTRTFLKGQTVVVVVASQYLKNVDQKNVFNVYDPAVLPARPVVYGNPPYNDPVGQTTKPSSTRAFTYFGFVGDFYVYEFRFSTDSGDYGWDGVQLAYGQYSVEIELQANGVDPPKNRFDTVDSITVTDSSGSAPDFPAVKFYKDAGHTQEETLFNSTDIMYVKVIVNNTDLSVTVGDVVIVDFVGKSPIWATPGTPPIGDVIVNGSSSYAFNVDLSNPNYDNWNFGLSSYGFRIKRIADTNEEYAIASQVLIRGPRWNLDVITALNDYTFRWFGDDETWYSTFYENDGVWTRTAVESWREQCFFIWCFSEPPWGGGDFLDVAFGDVDEDGDLDAVFGLQVGKVLYYRNMQGTGKQWAQYEIDTIGDDVEAVAIGRLDRDSDNDIVAGTDAGEVWYYNNDGSWTPTLIVNLPTAVNVIKIADATNDGFNDIIVGTQSGDVRIYINDGFGSFGTQFTADYLMTTDLPVEGTVTGSVANTHTSDDTYESIQEVSGSGETIDYYVAQDEIIAAYDIVFSGSFQDTWAEDLKFQEIEEEVYSSIWPWQPDRYLLRNSSSGEPPGHQYYLGNVPMGPSDRAYLLMTGYLSQGTEAMQIGYKVGTGEVNVIGTLTETLLTRKIYDLTAAGFTGGGLYIVLQDTDTSWGDDTTGDGMATRVSVDAVVVAVVRQVGTTSRLEHQWRSGVIGSGGDSYKLFVEAHHSTSTDEDDFKFQWAAAQTGPWSDLKTVTKTEDDDTYQTASLPPGIGGTQIYLRVVDTNRTPDGSGFDTVYIDHIFVRRYITNPTYDTIPVGTAVNDLTLADMDDDDDLDVIVGAGSNAIIYYGTTWGSSRVLAATGTVNAVDVGYIDAGDTFDVVVGTANDRVYWFANDGTWLRTLIASLNDDVTSLRAGDVDGDYWDDIVIATREGIIRWLRHDQGTSWENTVIDAIDTIIYAIDIGDVDRGVVIDPAVPPQD